MQKKLQGDANAAKSQTNEESAPSIILPFVFCIAAIAICLCFMWQLYPLPVLKSALDSTQFMLDFLILFVGVFIIDLLKKLKIGWLKEFQELPIFATEQRRWITTFFVVFAFNLFVIIPHRLYVQSMGQSDTSTNDLSFYKEWIDFDNNSRTQGGELVLEKYGLNALQESHFYASKRFYEMSVKMEQQDRSLSVRSYRRMDMDTRCFYAFDILMMNGSPTNQAGYDVLQFHSILDNWTNDIYTAVYGG